MSYHEVYTLSQFCYRDHETCPPPLPPFAVDKVSDKNFAVDEVSDIV